MNKVVEDFMKLYHDYEDNPIYGETYYMGIPCLKCPMDMWIYQEIIHETKPDTIIETGSYMGASALYMAHILDNIESGGVVSIDIVDFPKPIHDHIVWLYGNSLDQVIFEKAKKIATRVIDGSCMVILDSDHSKQHVLNELKLYSPLVTVGQYLIVEDTNVNGHPVFPNWGEGPYEAVKEFLSTTDAFVVDKSREKFLMTFNPGGYLKRVK